MSLNQKKNKIKSIQHFYLFDEIKTLKQLNFDNHKYCIGFIIVWNCNKDVVDANGRIFPLAPDHRERVAAKGSLLERSRPKAGYPHHDKEQLILLFLLEEKHWNSTGCRRKFEGVLNTGTTRGGGRTIEAEWKFCSRTSQKEKKEDARMESVSRV